MEHDPFGAIKRRLGFGQKPSDGPNVLGPDNTTPLLPLDAVPLDGAPNTQPEESEGINPAVAAARARAEQRRRLLDAEQKTAAWLREQADHLRPR
jgi:hypothetical protein